MKNLEEMSRDERSLLTFFECMVIDNWGRIQTSKMNDDDYKIAEKWKEEKFIQFGRMPSKYILGEGKKQHPAYPYINWVRLSDEAFELAYQERKNRALRNYHNLDEQLAEYGFSVNGRLENEN